MSGVKSALRLEVLLLFLFVVATNRWLGWQEGIRYVQADDSRSYELMSEAAPGLPTLDSPRGAPLYHHAQRLFIHYLVGSTAKISGIELGTVYHAAVLLTALAIAFVAQQLLLKVGLAEDIPRRILLAAFIFNPYAFRYYWIAPTAIADLVYVLGLGITLLGLIEVRASALLAGALLAALGRQTLLLALPGISLWILLAPDWRKFPSAQRAIVVAATWVIVVGIYVGSGAFVLPFTGRMVHGADIFAGLAKWLVSDAFSFRMLGEHLLRVFIPALMLLSLAATFLLGWGFRRLRDISVEFWTAWLIAAATGAQPLILDPYAIGKNQSRQSALALLAVLTATAYLFRDARWRPENRRGLTALAVVGGAIAVASFHHMYTVVGPPGVELFAALHVLACGGAGAGLYIYIMILREKYARKSP